MGDDSNVSSFGRSATTREKVYDVSLYATGRIDFKVKAASAKGAELAVAKHWMGMSDVELDNALYTHMTVNGVKVNADTVVNSVRNGDKNPSLCKHVLRHRGVYGCSYDDAECRNCAECTRYEQVDCGRVINVSVIDTSDYDPAVHTTNSVRRAAEYGNSRRVPFGTRMYTKVSERNKSHDSSD